MENARKKILFITTQFPYPADSGGKIVTAAHLELLLTCASVTLVAKFEEEVAQSLINEKFGAVYLFKHWITTRTNPLKAALTFIKSIIRFQPYKVLKHRSSKLENMVTHLVKNEHYDFVVIDQLPAFSPLLKKKLPLNKTIICTHNAEFETILKTSVKKGFFKNLLLKWELNKLKNYEELCYASVKNVLFLSASDRCKFNLSNAVEFPLFDYCFRDVPIKTDYSKNNEILIIGSLSWIPNAVGLMWFVLNVFPLLGKNTHLTIVGKGLSDQNQTIILNTERVDYVGYVENLDECYERASVLVVPVFTGSGVKLKMIEGVKRGIPTVISKHVAEGQPEYAELCDVAENQNDFVLRCSNYLENPQLRMETGAKMKNVISTHNNAGLAFYKDLLM